MSLQKVSSTVLLLLNKIGWQRMAKREKLMVSGLAVVLGLLIFFQFIFSPLLDSRQRLQKSLVSKQNELLQMQNLQKELRLLQNKSGDIKERIGKRAKSFTLFSFIEKEAANAKIKQKIKYMKPSKVEGEAVLHESRVDMKLQDISLASLVEFLKGVEAPEKAVFISRISIQEYGKNKGSLNAVIQVITFTVEDA